MKLKIIYAAAPALAMSCSKSEDTNPAAISSGKLTGLKATSLQVPSGKCLIASSVTSGQFGENATTVHNSEGRLLKIIFSDTEPYSYTWSNGVVVSSIYKNSNSLQREDWFYTSGKLTKIIRYETGDPEGPRTYTYPVNAAGQPTQVDFSTGGKWTYNYDANGNCTSANFGGNSTETYSNYDNKPNSRTYLTAALGVVFMLGDEGGSAWSKNNVGTESNVVSLRILIEVCSS